MSESSSSSSSSSVRVTKLTAAGKVPAWYFMDIPTEDTKDLTTDEKLNAAKTEVRVERLSDKVSEDLKKFGKVRVAEFPELAKPSNARQQQAEKRAAKGAATPLAKKLASKGTTVIRALAALAILAVVVLILAAVAVKLYHHEEEVLPEVKNYVRQRMNGLWAKVDMSDYLDYMMGLFTNKRYVLQVTPEGSTSFLDLFKWKKTKKFNVKIADL